MFKKMKSDYDIINELESAIIDADDQIDLCANRITFGKERIKELREEIKEIQSTIKMDKQSMSLWQVKMKQLNIQFSKAWK